jgi:AcrR family transcriptional regulator
MASEYSRPRVVDATAAKIAEKAARQAERAERQAERARQQTERHSERAREQAERHLERAREKAARHADALNRLSDHLATLDVWTRVEPGRRRPRFSRDEIAAAAVRIADTEGLEAVSMRRLAVELDAGTMTLYYYLRTKDELLALIVDEVMGEVVLPAGEELPADWRAAVTVIASRSREALRRHPWILDIRDDPALGPNSVRHFDQSMKAVSGLDVPIQTKLDIINAVDEYVFGYCGHERTTLHEDAAGGERMRAYVNELVATGDYPELSRLVAAEGIDPLWAQVTAHAQDPGRFDRNLRRLLDGIEADLTP